MKSRNKFVKQVANTIIKNHNVYCDASFIFGISGKWGEGKTFFLDDLKNELSKKDFKIVSINPWKFAFDKVSFMRYFLAELSKEKSTRKKVINWIFRKDNIKDLYYDSTKYKIRWMRLLIYILSVALVSCIYYIYIPTGTKTEIEKYIPIVAASLIPIVISIIGNLITAQRGSKAINTTDEFDSLLNEVLNDIDKNIVIYVDDLDRVTPEIARSVLDNLRTFFDRGRLSFVVTGDHTVLERYIGEQTLPHKDEPEQLEEGRRFLKKIFNVYWKLPLPIVKEFQEFLDGEYKKREAELKKIFMNEEDKQKFLSYLVTPKYFEMNFRQIIRFLDIVVFTFQIIDAQVDSASEETKKYFDDLKKKPLLVVRILMFQELCPPLFERILNDPTLLSDLEQAVEKKDASGVTNLIGNAKNLSPTQMTFIKKFIYEEPRFFKNRMWNVYSIEPFLHLAADASFGDQRGPSSEDFVDLVKIGDPEQVKNSLANSGQLKMQINAQATLEFIQGVAEIPNKGAHLKTLLSALKDLPAHIAQDPFVEKLKGIDLTPYATESSEIRISTYTLFWDWLNTQNKSEANEDYVKLFPYQVDEDMSQLEAVTKGRFTSKIITIWLWNYYSRNERDSLEKMKSLLPALVSEVVKDVLTPHVDGLITSLVLDTDPDIKANKYFVVTQYTEDGSRKLKKVVLDSIKNLHEEIGQWAMTKVDEVDDQNKDLWTRKEIEQKIYDALHESPDIIKVLTYAKDKIPNESNEVWNIILNSKSDEFVKALPEMISLATFNSYIPPKKYAERLFKKIVTKIKSSSDDEKLTLIPYLKRDLWLWLNLNHLLEKKQIMAWTRLENEAIKEVVNSVIESWEGKATTIV